MRAMTSAASAICGTHLGDTNEVASTLGNPAAVRRSTSSTLMSVEMISFSFCRPSRGETSTILTRVGSGMSLPVYVCKAGPVGVDCDNHNRSRRLFQALEPSPVKAGDMARQLKLEQLDVQRRDIQPRSGLQRIQMQRVKAQGPQQR